jgi:hypothetical protein
MGHDETAGSLVRFFCIMCIFLAGRYVFKSVVRAFGVRSSGLCCIVGRWWDCWWDACWLGLGGCV